jgi:hypothetical protein
MTNSLSSLELRESFRPACVESMMRVGFDWIPLEEKLSNTGTKGRFVDVNCEAARGGLGSRGANG